MAILDASHLEQWAASAAAQSQLPRWLKALIVATVDPAKLRMPSGDATWLPGYDGLVVSTEQHRFVPSGFSRWELSTEHEPTNKANRDYKKRTPSGATKTDDIFGQMRSDITFVFATPRLWKQKEAWVHEKSSQGLWKDVVALDAVDLLAWFEEAASVRLQFAAELGLVPPDGLLTPDQAWQEWSHLTEPPTTADLILAGRATQAEQLVARLLSQPDTCVVRGDSPREAWGFALAALLQATPPEQRDAIKARTLVASDEETAGRLRGRRNLIVLLRETRGQVSGALSSSDCHLVVPEGNEGRSDRNVLTLARPSHLEFTNALATMGIKDEEAEKAARACGLSVTILQRQRPHANYLPPKWASESIPNILLSAILAGRWDSKNLHDRSILTSLAGVADYEEFEADIRPFLHVDEAPVKQIGTIWIVNAPADAFQLIASNLKLAHLRRFATAFREIFERIDPKVEIPPDEWIYHDSAAARHSEWLRAGMAESLLLISERGAHARLHAVESAARFAEEVIRSVPALNSDWRVLASLRDQYPRLMEAAPSPLLDSLEHLLEADGEQLKQLFAEGGVFGGGAMQSGLLWGLETIAWFPAYLERAALCLVKLAAIDPGGRYLNRPINSLRDVFLWWRPGTHASTAERLRALDRIRESEPNVWWSLLEHLLPSSHSSFASETAKPRWRDVGLPSKDASTKAGMREYAVAIIDRALEAAGPSPSRWKRILGAMRSFPQTRIDRAIELLSTMFDSSMSSENRVAFWDILREFIGRHRQFANAGWTLDAKTLTRLEALSERLKPSDPLKVHAWLFDSWLPSDGSDESEDASTDSVLDARKRRVDAKRVEVLKAIHSELGAEAVVRLGTNAEQPNTVAVAAVAILRDRNQVMTLVDRSIGLGEKGVHFASLISSAAIVRFGDQWEEMVRHSLATGEKSPEIVAELLKWWPDEPAIWRKIADLGADVERHYWKRKGFFGFDGSAAENEFEARKMLDAGRPTELFTGVSMTDTKLPPSLLLQIFDESLRSLYDARDAAAVRRLGITDYYVRRYLDYLRDRKDIDRKDVAKREYAALPILGFGETRNLTLHEFMAEDAGFFVEVLCHVFFPASRDRSVKHEPSPDEKARASAGYRLLQSMHRVPGFDADGTVRQSKLEEWVVAVKNEAQKQDREKIAEEKIGEILAHSPVDTEDGHWPHRAVRNVIERFASADIERGIAIERHNMRGVHSKQLFEGGEQERQLERQYHSWSVGVGDHWPKTARLLQAIARDWAEQARHADLRAEQRKFE